MIPVGRLAPGDQWDTNMVDLLLANKLYPTGLEFKHVAGYPPKSGGILVVPGRYWHARMPDIEDAVASHDWLLLIRTSDEEDLFNVNDFAGPAKIKFWVQTPRTDRDYGDARLFGVGFPPHFNHLSPDVPERDLDIFLSAQDTHERRHEAFQQLRSVKGPAIIEATSGFTKGLAPDRYAYHMMTAKVAPAPAGPASPDTFRLFEALEAHAIPIADDITPAYDSAGFWRELFVDAPFPILTDYASLPGYIESAIRIWPYDANRIAAWWMRAKRQMAIWLHDDLKALGAL